MYIILIITIFISTFQFILLVNKKDKSFSDRILAFWMAVIAIHLTTYILYYLGYWNKYPHLVGTTVPFPLLYGPLLYLYISYSLKNENQLRKKDYLHFAPTIFSTIYMCKFFFFYSENEKRLVDIGELDDFSLFSKILLIVFIVSGIAYSIMSFKLLNNYKHLIESNFSDDKDIDLNWLKGFIWSSGAVFFSAIMITITRDFLEFDFKFNPDAIIYTMISFSTLLIGYYGIRHQNIFVDNEIVEYEDVIENNSYIKSGLKESDAINMHGSLLKLMKEEKLFLQPKLTLNNLANLLMISPNHLSQIINQYEEQNFNDFVNKYRIEEFIEKASYNNSFSFLAHAYDSGFNSKSTFNNVFKKIKGVTPSQYINGLKNENIPKKMSPNL